MNRPIRNLLIGLLLLSSCGDKNTTAFEPSEWSVPVDEVFDGGPGKDGIPAIDNPNFTVASEVDYLDNEDLVLGIRIGNDIHAYPHDILDWHEIINDEWQDKSLAITYCPLTGTGVAWNRIVGGNKTTFGVSGLLYNTNLMPYDRATNSTWSQQRLDCVNGPLRGETAEIYTLVETKWSVWKASFPESKVVNLNTGVMRSYGSYPYGDYKTNNDRLLFPVVPIDNRLPLKERVLGVLSNGDQRVYRFNDGSPPIDIVYDQLGGKKIVVVRSAINNLLVAFDNPDDLQFAPASPLFPELLEDKDGNVYDILGELVIYQTSAQPLRRTEQFIGYWFSWGAFFPGIEIYPN